MPRRRYKDVDNCRPEIQSRAQNLRASSDDADDEMRDEESAEAYIKDLRWFDHWLDEHEVEAVTDLTVGEAENLGYALVDEFHGTTPQNRWKQIYNLYDRLYRNRKIDENPLERWDGIKSNEFGINKTTEQEKHLEDGEDYAPSSEEIRMMEQNVGAPRGRNQALIRFLHQTGLRRGEAEALTIDDIHREEREVIVRAEHAKNDKRRVVAWQPSLDAMMDEWLDVEREMFTNGDENNRWLWVNRGGGRLSAESINEVVVKAARNAGINRALYADANAPLDDDGEPIPNRWKISAHNLRVALGTYLANETDMGIYELSKVMGHSSVGVTEDKYISHKDRAGLDDLKKYGRDM